MAKTKGRTEKRVKEVIKNRVKDLNKIAREQQCAERDVIQVMPVNYGSGTTGVSDFLFCVRGRFIAIETKAEGKIDCAFKFASDDSKDCISEMQERFIRRVNATGGVAFATASPDFALAVIEWALDNPMPAICPLEELANACKV